MGVFIRLTVWVFLSLYSMFGWIFSLWRRRSEPPIPPPVPKVRLLCMRLDDMVFVHPEQITQHCSLCDAIVGIYPSGQRILFEHPDAEIICHVCGGPHVGAPAPGALDEPAQSVRRQ